MHRQPGPCRNDNKSRAGFRRFFDESPRVLRFKLRRLQRHPQELLKVFYGCRDQSVEEMSDDEILKLVAIHSQLAQAHVT